MWASLSTTKQVDCGAKYKTQLYHQEECFINAQPLK